ncbi:MAG: type II toxin-antitoxin system HicA family toxin [Armatimonadota bacterium]
MKLMTPRQVIRLLKKNGWHEIPAVGGHRQFEHSNYPNKITVPFHNNDLKPKTLASILKQAGLLD